MDCLQWKEVEYIRDEWRASNGLRVRKQEMDGCRLQSREVGEGLKEALVVWCRTGNFSLG